ncbi:MAG: Hpt domain-containing protein [Desulfobacteraceae bacterium]|jgi:HPt (histidine-containing phosphotransfer) domain-containing protein|nr:Hpt domain-containing protein [Desulfobacteraceae bacterium]
MNFRKLSKNLGLEEEEYIELFELFVETSMEDLNKLWFAIDIASTEKVVSIAHSLKGASLNLGLNEFQEIAEAIGKTARDGQLEKTAQLAKTLQEKLDNVAGVVGC